MPTMARAFGLAALVAALAGATTALSQTGTTWVDPPSRASGSPTTSAAPRDEAPAANPAPAARPVAPEPARGSTTSSIPAARPDEVAASQRTAGAASTRQAPQARERTARIRPRAVAAQQKPASIAASRPRIAAAARLRSARLSLTRQAGRVSRSRIAAAERGMPAMRGIGNRRVRTVGQALASGLQVMRLRTIEFPDGRRVSVLSRPDPDTMRELLAGD